MKFSYFLQKPKSTITAFSAKIIANDCFLKSLMILSIIIIIFAHTYKIAEIPNGLYIDETSIAINAASISKNGTDEYGVSWPLYFKAFGEYKNPVYIYINALVFKIFGISVWALRITSSFFYLLGLIPLTLLFLNLTKSNCHRLFLVLATGFLPQYFIMSRVSFEVISHFSFISWSMYLIYMIFERPKSVIKYQYWDQESSKAFNKFQRIISICFLPIVLGVVLGVSLYTYSTARLLTALLVLSLVYFYRKKQNWLNLCLTLMSFTLFVLPWLWFFFANPDRLANRFKDISYITNPDYNWWQKIYIFIGLYINYIGNLDFLILRGDTNLRHSIGVFGLVFVSVFIIGWLGIVRLIRNNKNNFEKIILVNFFLAPLAASLTLEGWPHMLRTSLVGVYFLIACAFGLNHIKLKNNYVLLLFLLIEIVNFNICYFYRYKNLSSDAFQSSGFMEALEYAYNQNPAEVIVSNMSNQSYVNLKFGQYIVPNPNGIKTYMGDIKVYNQACLIFYRHNEPYLNSLYNPPYYQYGKEDEYVKVRCWKDNIRQAQQYLNESVVLYNAGKYQESLVASLKALQFNPNDATVYNNICSASNQLEKWDDAIEACTKAIELEPSHSLAKNNLAYAKQMASVKSK